MEQSIDRDRVREIVEILKSSEATELSLSDGELTITVKQAATTAPAAPTNPQANTAAPQNAVGDQEDLVEVEARLVGLFYAGSGPGGEPLVQEGDTVEEGQTIGTIEALRNFTEVVSPVDGTIREILAEEGTAVQYGDVLFVIKP